MSTAKKGDTVRVHYTGMLDDESVFDSSYEREPLEFTVGTGQVIPGFEDSVIGMSPGDTITTLIPSDEAYGPHHEEMVATLQRTQLPEHIEPQIGQQLQVNQQDGEPVVVQVTEINDTEVTLDANHPLAGKDLTFRIEMMEIV